MAVVGTKKIILGLHRNSNLLINRSVCNPCTLSKEYGKPVNSQGVLSGGRDQDFGNGLTVIPWPWPGSKFTVFQ